jgi:hypothetical protein
MDLDLGYWDKNHRYQSQSGSNLTSMQIYQKAGYSKWTDVDDVISIQKYCMDDAAITMKIMKNRVYGSSAIQFDPIISATGPTQVDGEPWWRLDLNYAASKWMRDLNDPRVVEITGAAGDFEVPEDIYILTKLKWS